jgi:O-methyltransferase involved in polyketide biosynthesis
VTEKLSVELGEIQQSMLVAVYLRAIETRRPDAMVRDLKALEIVERVDFDFHRIKTPLSTQLDAAIRAEVLDEQVGLFVQQHPDGIVVNLGSGLDGRFWRVDNGRIRWFDVDMPDSLVVRRKFYEEGPRNRFIAASMFDGAWIDAVNRQPDEPLLIVAEGVLVFFPEEQLRELFRMIADRLPGAEMLFWSVGPGARRQIQKRGMNQSMLPVFRWEIESGAEVATWDPRIRFVAEFPFVDRHPERWPLPQWLLKRPRIYRRLRGAIKITHIRFARPDEPPAPLPAEALPPPPVPRRSWLEAIDQAGFLIGFLTSMIAAGRGYPWLGPLAVLLVVMVRLVRDPHPRAVLAVIAAVTAIGVLVENAFHAYGIVRYHEPIWPLGTCPLWAVFLWINFSSKLTNPPQRLVGQYAFSALVGGLVTPVAYQIGQRVGALDLGPDALTARVTLAIFGALLMPAGLWLANRANAKQ